MTFLHLYVIAHIAHIAHWEKELWSHQMHSEQQQQSMIHSLSTHGFRAGPQSKEELKANSTIGLQPKGLKVPRGSVSQHRAAYVGWKREWWLKSFLFDLAFDHWRKTCLSHHHYQLLQWRCCWCHQQSHAHNHHFKCETGTPHCIPRQREFFHIASVVPRPNPSRRVHGAWARAGSYWQRLPKSCNPHGL